MPRSGTVNYHVHSPEQQAYHIDPDGVVGRLVSPTHAPTLIRVNDEREGEASVCFESDSVTFEVAPTSVASFADAMDFEPVYEEELRDLLRAKLGAREVLVFDHTIRIDDAASNRKPARNVHSDYSPRGAEQRLVDLLGEADAAAWSQGHYAFINVWRPIGEPITSAPLGFVRPSSTRTEDWIQIDLVYPDRTGHIMGLASNPQHEWIYRSRMTPDEVVLFNIYDNRGKPSVGHSAIDMVEDEPDPKVRRSIESRTVVRF